VRSEDTTIPTLSGDARSIVDAARAGEDPTEADLARVRGRLFAHLGVGLAAGGSAALVSSSVAEAAATTAAVTKGAAATAAASATATTAAIGAASGAATTTAVTSAAGSLGFFAQLGAATKVGIAVLALGGASTVIVATRAPDGAPQAVEASPRVEEEARPRATDPRPPTPSAAEPHAEAAPAEAAPAPPPVVEPAPPAAPAEPAAPKRASSADAAPRAEAPDPLIEETALIGRAQSALAAGDHVQALAILDDHARRFPRGVLAQEREGARWVALCSSGQAGRVRGAVSSFLAKNPSSPLAPRLRAACGISAEGAAEGRPAGEPSDP
jgi:hypothetical protein